MIILFWHRAEGSTLEELNENLKKLSSDFTDPYIEDPNKSFKITVEAFNKKLSSSQKLKKIEVRIRKAHFVLKNFNHNL